MQSFVDAGMDSETSEFYHMIYFDGNHRPPLKGYSQKVGFKEKYGTIPNFINYVLRLMKSGYYPGSPIRRIEQIDYFNNQTNDLIVRLHPGYAMWEPNFFNDKGWRFALDQIEKMFSFLEKDIPLIAIQNQLSIKRKNPGKDGFNATDLTPRFATDRSLVKFAQELLKKGYPQGEVEHYVHLYRGKHFAGSYTTAPTPKHPHNGQIRQS